MSKFYSLKTVTGDVFGWDRALAALFCRAKAGETVSLMSARAAADGRLWGCRMCRLLDVLVAKGHCTDTLNTQSGEITGWAAYRAGFFLALLGLLIWAILGIPFFMLAWLLIRHRLA